MASEDNNPYASPQFSPESDDPVVRRPGYFMSPAPVERGEGNDPSVLDRLFWRAFFGLGVGLAVGDVALAVLYPTIWAIVTTILLVAVLGLLTTKVVLRIDNPLKMWCWAPLFGLGWLLLLWLLFQLRFLF